jgi:hypothetical protein
MRSLKFRALSVQVLCAILLLSTAFGPAQAKWFSHKKTPAEEAVEKVQTFQPPAVEAMQRYCEPFRAEAVSLAQKPKWARPFYEPRRMWLMGQHQKCRQELMDQEHIYLKHADIEQSPSLPKMNADAPKPGGPNGNLP